MRRIGEVKAEHVGDEKATGGILVGLKLFQKVAAETYGEGSQIVVIVGTPTGDAGQPLNLRVMASCSRELQAFLLSVAAGVQRNA